MRIIKLVLFRAQSRCEDRKTGLGKHSVIADMLHVELLVVRMASLG